nr:sulfatase-like hydrolase/transferase [Pirellulaceae bacterium]
MKIKINYLLLSTIVFILFATNIAQAAKPNFILIFIDDQGYGDLSCFGSKKIQTPNIDRLSVEGRKFTSF